VGLQAVTEAELQQAIVDAAGLFGWLAYHTHDSRHSAAGFPDLVLVKPPRLIFAELKTETGRPSPAQLTWAQALSSVAEQVDEGDFPAIRGSAYRPSIEVYLWRPADWRDGTVERVLRGV
jgi:hypothetical protein